MRQTDKRINGEREMKKEKGERRKEKGERRKEKGERRKEKGERRKEKKRFVTLTPVACIINILRS